MRGPRTRLPLDFLFYVFLSWAFSSFLLDHMFLRWMVSAARSLSPPIMTPQSAFFLGAITCRRYYSRDFMENRPHSCSYCFQPSPSPPFSQSLQLGSPLSAPSAFDRSHRPLIAPCAGTIVFPAVLFFPQRLILQANHSLLSFPLSLWGPF